jgi:drug/metabolite transporter (DMT)-like permease
MSERLKVFLAMAVAMIFWGVSFIWSEQALAVYNPFTVVLFRLIISVALLYILNIWLKRIEPIASKDLPIFILLSFLQPFAYFIGENYGIVYTDATTTSVVIATIPLFSPLAAYFFLKEKVTLINIVGIVISIVGVALVILKDDLSFTADLTGLLLLFGAVIAAVLYSVVVVNLSGKYGIYSIAVWQNVIGIAWFIPVFFLFDFNEFRTIGFQAKPFFFIALLAVFGSTLCFLFFIYGVKKLGITRANIFGNSIPVFTAFFAFILLGRTFTWLNVLGILLVLTGVTVTQIKRRKLKESKQLKIKRIYPKA